MFRNDAYLDSLRTVAQRCERLAVNGKGKWFNVTECRIRAVHPRDDGYVYEGCPECEKKLDEGVRQCENPRAKHRIPREVLQRHLFFKVHVDVVDRHGFVLEMYLPDKMLEKLVPNFDAGNLLINDEDGHAVERTQDEQKALLETKLQMDRRLTVTVLAKRTEYNTISYTAQRVEISEPVVILTHKSSTPKKENAKLQNQPRHTVVSDLPKPLSQSRARNPVRASTSALEVESPKVAATEEARGVKRAHGVSNAVTSANASPKGAETRSSKRKNPLVDIEEEDESADEEDDAATSSDDGNESSADED
ncbi:hypothetical protein RvY_09230 [Ramazzottius varieornatus]|uniref:Uncharacterized protein n=1 Tax=Ramazzottius varieornatus TaxID=947166 RepID=A0A1D1V8N0_RAMVA|nr:hypothetical protein RvY_09230 [Ramazzottius varieornatus]